MNPRHLAALLALFSGLLACGDATRPTPRLGVNLSLDGQPRVTESVSPDGQLSIRCDFSLVATARNTGTATWADAVTRFYFGRDRKVASDSVALSASEVQRTWGRMQFTSDVVSRSEWYASAGVPFDAELEFRFADGVEPAKTRFTCGPPVVAASEPPSVTSISVLPASGTVQAGDTLRITWTASAPSALWSTEVRVGGPFGFFQVYPEHGASSTTRTAKVVVPPSAFFSVPIGVTVTATDPGLMQGSRGMQTPLTVVDETPPVVRSVTLPFTPNGAQFFAGDTIAISVDAFDNSKLAWFVWDVTGAVTVHDSVRAPVGMTSGTMKIPLVTSTAWLGASSLAVYVRDGVGAASAVSSAGTVRVAPTFPYPVSAVATAPTASSDRGDITFDAKRGKIYLTLGQRNDLDVLDVSTATFGTPIALPSPGAGLDLSASGDSLIVVEPATKSLAVVNLAQGGTPTIIPLTVLDTAGALTTGVAPQPRGVRVGSNGVAVLQLLYRTASGDGVVSLDLGTGVQRLRSDGQPRVGPLVEMMAATPDRAKVVIFDPNCPRLYVASTDTFTPCGIPRTPYDIQPLQFDAAGRRFSVGIGVFDLSFNRLDPSPSIFSVSGASVLSPDGETLYLATSNYVTLKHAVDGTLLGRFAVPFQPQALLMGPGGDWLMLFRRDDVVKAARVDIR